LYINECKTKQELMIVVIRKLSINNYEEVSLVHKKVLFILSMFIIISLAVTSISYADESFAKNSNLKIKEIYGKIFVEVPNAADPIAIPDGITRGIVVTASDVALYKVWGAHDWEYCADGYVTAAQYHYARAEIWYGSSYVIKDSECYGYNKVTSTTPSIYVINISGYTARIFYGS